MDESNVKRVCCLLVEFELRGDRVDDEIAM